MATTRAHGPCRLAAAMIAGFLVILLANLRTAEADTIIHDIRTGITSEKTRLVFDASGDKPSRILPPAQNVLVVEFPRPVSNRSARQPHFKHAKTIADVSLKNRDGSFQIVIGLTNPEVGVKHEILPGLKGKAGHYRLVLDFYVGGAGTAVETPAITPSSQEPHRNRNLSSAGISPPHHEKSQNAKREKDTEASGVPEFQEGTRPDPSSAEMLYQKADAYFESHQEDMVRHAAQILNLYLDALKADPRSLRAPGAFYRSGIVYEAIGNTKKAEKYLQQVISAGHDHPLYSKAWLKLGEIYHRNESYVEAIEAFRFALRSKLEKQERLEATYYLGRNLNAVGAPKEAAEILQQCFNEDPSYYLRRPDLIKFLGESYFSLKQYDKSLEFLFRYLNLAPGAPDRDLVLAKIAEIFLNLGDQKLAGKMYSHIQRHYRDSEGDIISRIRNAEMLERREHGNQGPALGIYRELSKKELSPALRRLVYFKLASWEWKHGDYPKSMALIEEILADKKDVTSHEEFLALREKVLQAWITRAAESQDNLLLVQIHEQYSAAFRGNQPLEGEDLIADAYAALGLHTNAAEIYERLLLKSRKRNEEWMLKLALYSFLMGDTDKAMKLCEQIQAPACEGRKSELLGRICAQQKKYGEAVKHFSRAIQKDGDVGLVAFEALLAYAESLMGMSRYDEALRFLTKCQEVADRSDHSKMLPLLLLLSRCQQELKQGDLAAASLEAALEHASSEEQKSRLNYELSRLYLGAGETDKASQKLSQLLASTQSFWKTAAQQQLEAIKMAKPKTP